MSDQFLRIMMFVIWSIIIVVSVIVEFSLPAVYFGWATGLSGASALLTHGVRNDYQIEIIVFVSVWIPLWISMFLIGKFVLKKRLHDKEDGYNKYVGKAYKVVKANTSDEFGLMLVDGKEFRFSSKNIYKSGEDIVIKSIKGVTAYIDE